MTSVHLTDFTAVKEESTSVSEVASGAHTGVDLQTVNCRTDGHGHCEIIDLSVSVSTMDERAERHMDTDFC